MKQIQRKITPVLVALFLIGCATTGGGDPILVNAQKTIKRAKLTMTAFIHLERDFETQLKAVDPNGEVHKAAENIRAHGQQWLRDAWAAIEAYRLNKDQSGLDKALAVIESAAASSQHYINFAKTKGVTK